MHRFFLDPQAINQGLVTFPADVSKQMLRVLRLQHGDEVVVLPGDGSELVVRLDREDNKIVTGFATTQRIGTSEPSTRLTMLIGLTQREKFEFILQKCTEIGVASFIPLITSRTLQQSTSGMEQKQIRWQAIIKEAAEQSGRALLPEIHPVMTLGEGLRHASEHSLIKMVAWEDAKGHRIRDILNRKPVGSVALLIGPEGGLSMEEISNVESFGFVPVTLGTRILRMETAAIVSAALVFDEMEKP